MEFYLFSIFVDSIFVTIQVRLETSLSGLLVLTSDVMPLDRGKRISISKILKYREVI